MIHLTKNEKCLLLVIAKDEYNVPNGDWKWNDPPSRSDLDVWTNIESWKNEMNYEMKLDRVKSFTNPEVKGFLGSLVKKGLVWCSKESAKKENDETTGFTELGYKTIIEIKKEKEAKMATPTTPTPTKKDMVKSNIISYLNKNNNVDQAFLIREFNTIAGKTTITDALKEMEKAGVIEKLTINKLICWNLCAVNPLPDEIAEETPEHTVEHAVEPVVEPVIETTPALAKIAVPSLKEKLVNAGKKVRSKISLGKTKEKVERPRSQYGRLLSSAVGVIDSLLLAGTTTEDEIINAIQKKFPQKTKQQIVNRMKSHLRQLKKEGVKITEKDGVVKVKAKK